MTSALEYYSKALSEFNKKWHLTTKTPYTDIQNKT
jgi:hypothetical protein